MSGDPTRPHVGVFLHAEMPVHIERWHRVIDAARIWSDELFYWLSVDDEAVDTSAGHAVVDHMRLSYEHQRRQAVFGYAMTTTKYTQKITHIAFLGADQIVVDPALIVPAIVANPNKILMATRYWMWGNSTYRWDSYWKPRLIPFVFPKRFLNAAAFSPAQAWPNVPPDAGARTETPIEIQDFSFYDPADRPVLIESGRDVRPYQGVELLS